MWTIMETKRWKKEKKRYVYVFGSPKTWSIPFGLQQSSTVKSNLNACLIAIPSAPRRFSTLNIPMFAATLGTVSAHSFLSQFGSIDASHAHSSSTSTSLVIHRPLFKQPSNFPAGVSLSQSSFGVLDTSPASPESVRRAQVSTLSMSFMNFVGSYA